LQPPPAAVALPPADAEPPVAQPPRVLPPAWAPKPRRQVPMRIVNVQFDRGGLPADSERSVLVPADRRMVQRLRLAQELIEKENFLDAARQLQGILELSEDGFFYPDPEQKDLSRSLKAEASSLIGRLPPAGLEAWRRQFGGQADAALKAALDADDWNALADVARLYPHTPGGDEATFRLGAWHLDHDRPLTAALYFERLRAREESRRPREPELSVRCALCWHRAGMTETADEILRGLAGAFAGQKLEVAGREIELAASSAGGKWLESAFGPPGASARVGRGEWTMVRGDPSRNPVALAGTRAVELGTWDTEAVAPEEALDYPSDRRFQDDLRKSLLSLKSGYASLPQPPLSKAEPLVVGDQVLVRVVGNVVAFDARAGLTEGGERLWEAMPDWGLSNLQNEYGSVAIPQASQVLASIAAQWIYRDATFAGLSTDGKRVFAIEDSGLLNPPNVTSTPAAFAPSATNRLLAYDLRRDAKIEWALGGGDDSLNLELPMGGTFFLGAPLPLAGRLFVLAETAGEIRLAVLNPEEDGALMWEQPLATAAVGILGDRRRRTAGVTPAYADGVLVCPTGAGTVVALDLTTRSLLWGYRTGKPQEPPQPFFGRGRPRSQPTYEVVRESGWQDENALLAEQSVLLTPGDSDDLHCLDLTEGKVRWKKARGDALYVGGVCDSRVLVVSREGVQALKITNGAPAWDKPVVFARGDARPKVTGRGFLLSRRLYLPLSSAEVAVIDCAAGRIVARHPTPSGLVPGNLVCAHGTIVSQSPDRVESFPLPQIDEEKVARR
ncbi:MAG: PQQ-binding-like beta-propeller repeat protein, partial [Planctomycetes bacterium]|nr:PQQ-binding-like beta-propeller repeat protein [Planctomycetota bacterium]